MPQIPAVAKLISIAVFMSMFAAPGGAQKTSGGRRHAGGGRAAGYRLVSVVTPETMRLVRRCGRWATGNWRSRATPRLQPELDFCCAVPGIPGRRGFTARRSLSRGDAGGGKEIWLAAGSSRDARGRSGHRYMHPKLYAQHHDLKMLEPTKAALDRILPMPMFARRSCPPWHDEDANVVVVRCAVHGASGVGGAWPTRQTRVTWTTWIARGG